MTPTQVKKLTKYQISQITESRIYAKLANHEKNEHNKKVLNELSEKDLSHYNLLQKYTGKTPKPNNKKIWVYTFIARFFGLTFGVKFMEKYEVKLEDLFHRWDNFEDLHKMVKEEEEAEDKLISLIDEEGLKYMGAIVLALNDALIEFTGALAGYTFALQNSKMIALTGAITGVAATLSMGASEYLAVRADNSGQSAMKAAIYTVITYAVTIFALLLPFILDQNPYWSLAISLACAYVIIAVFNYYYTIVKNDSFKKRFTEMALVSTCIAAVSFGIGYALRILTGIDG